MQHEMQGIAPCKGRPNKRIRCQEGRERKVRLLWMKLCRFEEQPVVVVADPYLF